MPPCAPRIQFPENDEGIRLFPLTHCGVNTTTFGSS